MGSSEINMDEIYGYDFWKSNATAAQNGVSMSLKEMAYWEKTFTPMRIIPQKNKVYDVVFEINMDSSLVKQTNGDVKFFPKISSKVTSR